MLYWKDLETEVLAGELWVSVIGFKDLYEVSNLGRVRAVKGSMSGRSSSRRIRRQYWNKGGYLTVILFRDSVRKSSVVSSLVWFSFNSGDLPMRNKGMVVAHLNKVAEDNRLENLAFMTRGDSNRLNSKLGVNKGRNLGGHSYTQYTKDTSEFDIDGNVIVRICRDCKEKKGVSEFYPRMTQCKECQNIQSIKHRKLRQHGFVDSVGRSTLVIELENLVTGDKLLFDGIRNKDIGLSHSKIYKYANTGIICYWMGMGIYHPPYKIKMWENLE